MLSYGSKLAEPIPVDISIWHWIFDQALPNCRFNKGQEGGFRDAETRKRLSFETVKAEAMCLSTAIASKFGIRLGSHVAVFCQNSIWYPVINFAALRLGAIVTASSPEYEMQEMVHVLKTCEPELIYADVKSWNIVCKAAEKVNIGKDRVIFVRDQTAVKDFSDRISIHDLIEEAKTKSELGQVEAWSPSQCQSNIDIPAYLSFTSGTTSLPKGVMISHHNVIAQLMQMRSLTVSDCPKTLLAVLPFYHITGIVQLLQLPLVLNQEVVTMSKFNMQEMLNVVTRYKCEELWLVPPLLIRLVNDPIAADYNLEFVQQFNTGAAPLAKEIIHKLSRKFPRVRLRQAWGMTESCSALTLTPPSDQTYANAHTVGKAVPETIIKVIDPEYRGPGERILNIGESGEILAKGPQVTMGYYREPRATAESYDKQGFLHTGDIGFIDEAGFVVIHDRLKEMVKVKGVAVAPAEVEDLLLGHPLVADAAVIGIKDSYAGEVLKAFIVPKDMANVNSQTVKTLIEFVKGKMSRPKWLAGGIEFVALIPKSASGKVLRRILRAQAETKGNGTKQKLRSML